MSLKRTALTDSLNCLKNALPQFIVLILSLYFLNCFLYSFLPSTSGLTNSNVYSFIQKYYASDHDSFNNYLNSSQNLSDEELKEYFQQLNEVPYYGYFSLFASLFINSSIIAGTLAIIYCLTKYDKLTVLEVVRKTVSYLPSLFLIIFINQLVTGLGFVLFVIPGLLCLYGFQLAPIIKIVDQTSLIQAQKRSFAIMFKNSFALLPILFGFLLVRMVIILLSFSILKVTTLLSLTSLIVFAMNVGLTIFITIFLLRFYILTTQNIKNNANQYM